MPCRPHLSPGLNPSFISDNPVPDSRCIPSCSPSATNTTSKLLDHPYHSTTTLCDASQHNLFRHRPYMPNLSQLDILQYFTHNEKARGHVITPEVDVRETKNNYWIDIPLPGIEDHKQVVIEYSNIRELSVSGNIERPNIPTGDLLFGSKLSLDHHGTKFICKEDGEITKDGDVGEKVTSGMWHEMNGNSDKSDTEARMIIADRNVGSFHRTFQFPVDIDPENVRAKLHAGLLRIQVRKLLSQGHFNCRRVSVHS